MQLLIELEAILDAFFFSQRQEWVIKPNLCKHRNFIHLYITHKDYLFSCVHPLITLLLTSHILIILPFKKKNVKLLKLIYWETNSHDSYKNLCMASS